MLVCVSFKERKESWELVEELGAFCKREPCGQGSRCRTRGEVGESSNMEPSPWHSSHHTSCCCATATSTMATNMLRFLTHRPEWIVTAITVLKFRPFFSTGTPGTLLGTVPWILGIRSWVNLPFQKENAWRPS